MFKAIKEGTKSAIKNLVTKLDKKFTDIADEKEIQKSIRNREINLVKKSQKILKILKTHLEACFEELDVNYRRYTLD